MPRVPLADEIDGTTSPFAKETLDYIALSQRISYGHPLGEPDLALLHVIPHTGVEWDVLGEQAACCQVPLLLPTNVLNIINSLPVPRNPPYSIDNQL
jgi:hypothetical protein